MFSKDRDWLEGQPGMESWEEGCRELAEQLGKWLETYSRAVCEAVVRDDHEAWSEHMERLWQCLAYHWQQAAEANGGVPAREVVERIQQGQGYQGGGKLGGDPMRDVVLAVAMTLRDGTAPTVFEADYYEFSRRLAGKLNHALAKDPDQWWNELLDHLAGYTSPPGRLRKFLGYSAMQNWLGTVQWNFLRRWLEKQSKHGGTIEVGDMEETISTKDRQQVSSESLEHFVAIVSKAVRKIPKEDLLLIQMCFLEGLKQKEVAAILGIHSGNVGRRLQKVIQQLQANVEAAAAECFQDGSYKGILEELAKDSKAFATALCRALAEEQEDRS